MDHGLFKLYPDGTLEITLPQGTKVGRVLICEAGTRNGSLYYPENDVPDINDGDMINCTDCIKHGGDWECDRVHCHKGKNVSNDVISRKQAFEAIQDAHHHVEVMSMMDNGRLSGLGQASNIIRNLPSAEPERKKGKWNFVGDQMFECTGCGMVYSQGQFEHMKTKTNDPDFPRYCPNCGSYNGGKKSE